MISENDYKESLSKISEAISLCRAVKKQEQEVTHLNCARIDKQPKNVSTFRLVVSISAFIFCLLYAVAFRNSDNPFDIYMGVSMTVVTFLNVVYLIIKRKTYEKRTNNFLRKMDERIKESKSEFSTMKLRFDAICKELCIPTYYRKEYELESFRKDMQNLQITNFYECSSIQEWSKKYFDNKVQKEAMERELEEKARSKALADEFWAKERIGDHIIEGPSTWYDFRTGERLNITTEGKIINSEGEEVSPAWWD